MFEAEVLEGKALLVLQAPALLCERAAMLDFFRRCFDGTAAAQVVALHISAAATRAAHGNNNNNSSNSNSSNNSVVADGDGGGNERANMQLLRQQQQAGGYNTHSVAASHATPLAQGTPTTTSVAPPAAAAAVVAAYNSNATTRSSDARQSSSPTSADADEELATVLFATSDAVRVVLECAETISSGVSCGLELRRGFVRYGVHRIVVEGVIDLRGDVAAAAAAAADEVSTTAASTAVASVVAPPPPPAAPAVHTLPAATPVAAIVQPPPPLLCSSAGSYCAPSASHAAVTPPPMSDNTWRLQQQEQRQTQLPPPPPPPPPQQQPRVYVPHPTSFAPDIPAVTAPPPPPPPPQQQVRTACLRDEHAGTARSSSSNSNSSVGAALLHNNNNNNHNDEKDKAAVDSVVALCTFVLQPSATVQRDAPSLPSREPFALTPFIVYQMLCGTCTPRKIVMLPPRSLDGDVQATQQTRVLVQLDSIAELQHLQQTMHGRIVELAAPTTTTAMPAADSDDGVYMLDEAEAGGGGGGGAYAVEARLRLFVQLSVRHGGDIHQRQEQHRSLHVGVNSNTTMAAQAYTRACLGAPFPRRWYTRGGDGGGTHDAAQDNDKNNADSNAVAVDCHHSKSVSVTSGDNTTATRSQGQQPQHDADSGDVAASQAPHGVMQPSRRQLQRLHRRRQRSDSSSDGDDGDARPSSQRATATVTTTEAGCSDTTDTTTTTAAAAAAAVVATPAVATPAVASADDALPPGWRAFYSAAEQRAYYAYHDPTTGLEVTTWVRP